MKKLLLSLVALLTTVGAWAQLADGVYTIKNVINNRGTLVAVDGQTNVGATDITLSGYESRSETAMTDGDKWYVSTVKGNVFLYNIANGKFLNSKQADPVQFTDNPVVGFSLTANGDYYVISNGSFKVSCCPGYEKGQTVRWLSNDEADSQHLTFALVENGLTTFATQVKAANEAIASATSAKTNLQKLIDLVNAYESGTNIGDYTEDAIKGLKEAIKSAQAKIDANNVTDDDVEALQAVIDALEINLPETGKYYRFISAATTSSRGTNVVMVANRTSGKVEWKAYGEDGNINAEIDNLWTFVDNGSGKYYLMAANGGYVGSVAGGSAPTVLQTDVNNAGAYTLDFYTPGICKLFLGDAKAQHLWADGNNVICGWEGGVTSNSAWYIVPGTNIDVVVNEYASIYLPFAVEVEGAQAYAIESTNATHAVLTEKADIPAGQGAILAGNDSATLNIVAEASSDWSANLLLGSTTDTCVEGSAYVLANGTNGVGLYKAELNKDAEGNTGDTYFLNNANKAYLRAAGGEARFLSFDFGTETAIESIEGENGNVKADIYDLAGRRVQKAQKGLYIVNGVKVIK